MVRRMGEECSQQNKICEVEEKQKEGQSSRSFKREKKTPIRWAESAAS